MMNSVIRNIKTKAIVKAMIIKGHHDVGTMHRNAKGAGKKNEKLLLHILDVNKTSEYGRKYGFDRIKTVEEYRNTVPVTTFDDYQDYVVRMIDGGEENLITSLPLVGYAQSSGSVGARKFIPLTQPEVNIYTKYTVTRMLALADSYHKRKNGKGIKPARGLFVCPAYNDTFPNGMLCSNVADVAAKQLGFVYPYILNIPFKRLFTSAEIDYRYINTRFALQDRDTLYVFLVFFKAFADLLKYLEINWKTMVDDIEKGTISSLAKAQPEIIETIMPEIRPDPERAAELRAEFEKGFDNTIVQRIWPNLSVICGIGTSTFAPFSKAARKNTGDIPFDFSIYGASEGLFAAVDELNSPGQLMLVDSCFYEFIPMDDTDKVLSIDELEVGKEYEIIITNQSGLYRYKCGDVIKVTGYLDECPYIQFSYRKGQLLNIIGEKTTEEHMAAAVKELGKESGCTFDDWAVYVCMDEPPYNYVLLLENDKGIDMSQYDDLADQILRRVNPRYDYFVDSDMGRIRIRNQKPGTHQEWAKKRLDAGVPPSQLKPVRMLDTPDKEEFFISRIIDN